MRLAPVVPIIIQIGTNGDEDTSTENENLGTAIEIETAYVNLPVPL